MAASLGAATLPALYAATPRNIKIGYTCLTWNATPRAPENLEGALKDVSSLGYYKFETFAQVLESWDVKGELEMLIDRYKVPLTSGYLPTDLIDPSKRKENVENVIRSSKVIKKYKGTFLVLAGNGINRAQYNFERNRKNVI